MGCMYFCARMLMLAVRRNIRYIFGETLWVMNGSDGEYFKVYSELCACAEPLHQRHGQVYGAEADWYWLGF